ncbi:cation diffusion facilitator CzcD-associated flavoprotein CzcO [Humibacillus xanthopallidus]|uniref:Cation diffusion facilitator CzcD-associated flavoprotein CzcO n=1 Tax=Humibacillus xanthopallidus TaxID=412689 RepID=A0A543PL87_9MICO|nr:NAD(P)/FAD-dependent oxidoreductase [Humibacillus xanthopallidus]TQN44845.1 cation diffusion facilitator CzcD-associated flavoprotein CzcO [Humibacillus xanthopallidus]
MSHRSPVVDAYIIGAGPAGLATAAALKKRGLHGVVLDKSDAVGSSWRRHYDRLHLHTPRELSGLPGMAIPKRMGRWVSRDDVVRYLELYAAHFDLDVRLRTAVERVDRSDDGLGWALTLSDGSRLTAPYVVVATGFNHTPVEPDLPGLQGFSGEVVLSRTYRNGSPYAGKDVLVVGSGNTGTELAVDLAEHGAARVRLSVRTIPHILRRSAGPYAAQYTGITVRHLPSALVDRAAALVERATTPDLTAYGLPRPDTGLLTRVERDNAIPVQDVGIIDAIRSGRVEPVAALESFDGDGVVLSDGTRLEPDVVVLATGYSQGLEPLIGHLGLLDDKGHPVERGGATGRGARGLWFNGFTNPISGMLREIAIDAKKIALAMALAKDRRLKELIAAHEA